MKIRQLVKNTLRGTNSLSLQNEKSALKGLKHVLTRKVAVRFGVSVAVVIAPCRRHCSLLLLLLLLLLVVVMHGDNHQSTMLRGIRTHVSTFHLQNV
jgi:hypothetical protein